MDRLTNWQQLYEEAAVEFAATLVRHQQQLEAGAAERATLRELLDASRVERDQAREALALWSAAERDQALELARQLAAFVGAGAGSDGEETRRVVTRALWLMRPVRSASSGAPAPSPTGSDSGTYGAANG